MFPIVKGINNLTFAHGCVYKKVIIIYNLIELLFKINLLYL